MIRKIVYGAMVALLVLPAMASADESTLRFTNHFIDLTTTPLPDGNSVVHGRYYQAHISDKADDPLNNTGGECMGDLIVAKDGKITSGRGMCFPRDASGDGLAFAWKITEMYTTRCPDVCGTMQAIDGYGKFKGVTYSGAWTRTHVFTDGAVGIVKTTYTTK